MRYLLPRLGRILPVLLAGAWVTALPAATMNADGRRLTVTTSNMTMIFDGGAVVSLENRISGEIYSRPRMASQQPDLSLPSLLGNRRWPESGS